MATRTRRTPEEQAAAKKAKAEARYAQFVEMERERRQLAIDSGVARLELLTSGDHRVCDECATLDRSVFAIDEAPVLPLHRADEDREVCRCSYLPARDPNPEADTIEVEIRAKWKMGHGLDAVIRRR